MKVAVVGGGIAGAAACYRLARAAVQVTWISAPRGATLLTSGALDVTSYQETQQTERVALSPGAIAFCETLGLHRVEARAAAVVTARGTIRYTQAADACVLNLNELKLPGLIGLPEVPLWGWDAPWTARSLNETASAFRGRFAAQPWSGPMPSAWFRSSHDCAAWFETERDAIAAYLRREAERAGVAGWLLPAACFAKLSQWRAFATTVGMPIGETLSGIEGLAGSRFEAAREDFAAKLGIERTARSITALAVAGDQLVLSAAARRAAREAPTSNASAPLTELRFDAAVLALGGVSGGGLLLDRGNQIQIGCDVSPAGTLALTLAGRPFSVSAEQGLDVSAIGLQKLTQIGVSLVSRTGPQRLAIAGDFVADRPRTLGIAIESGLTAAEELLTSLT